MSAIVGIYHFDGEPIRIEECKNVMKTMQKFPADDVQTWTNKNLFLGCHAQWITPESVGEVLPYYDYELKMAITADVIIDNRMELFDRLQVAKFLRKDITDSKLILLAYEKWGEEAPKYLVGDFAFMIWDEKRQLLFGARDFSGTRTLYFYNDGSKFAFSTIIEPLFSISNISKKLNDQWLAEFIAIPVTTDSISTDTTVYNNIKQLPPSHTIKLENGRLYLRQYSKFDYSVKLKLKSNGEYEEAFKEVFNTAVVDRLRTHRSVGAHLSGGLDSGSVVSFAAKALKEKKKRLHTFSYVPVDDFVDWTHRYRVANERPLIESTVNFVGNINDKYLSFPDTNPYSEIDDWLQTMEMPYKFFENSFWLKGIYEQASSQGVGLLLNGQRGNWTISFGPALDYYARLLRQFKFPSLYKEVNLYSKNIGVKKSRIMKFVCRKAFPEIARLSNSKNQECFPIWINPEFASRTKIFEKLEEQEIDISGTNTTDAYHIKNNQFNQLHFWGLNGTIGTKLSLRHSLWERDPTNDIRVVQFCLSVPDEQFVQRGLDRALVRRATNGLLPEDIRLNQRSRGVQGADGVHRMISSWKVFIDELYNLLKDPNVSSFVNNELLAKYIKRIEMDYTPRLIFEFEFRILMRSLILYRFLNKIEGR
ncbi:asparagine synthase-related protein [Bacillus sp. V2I10]|uniref:asparagine synthase-related protein n=1 Tax=Bacillus sp. V2I10 TaxID=3042276 RepID=UPI0027860210|nr:asparagine synthase-related protein [Bacillus sp. V2I10]MDQ0859293.1 asparagine synthase (glutamine-hydrolyzing) [Bacillus sp. V2I10]